MIYSIQYATHLIRNISNINIQIFYSQLTPIDYKNNTDLLKKTAMVIWISQSTPTYNLKANC